MSVSWVTSLYCCEALIPLTLWNMKRLSWGSFSCSGYPIGRVDSVSVGRVDILVCFSVGWVVGGVVFFGLFGRVGSFVVAPQ
jgi:hypothetical protein